MRTQVTVTRLRDIKLHAFRDRTGDKHVTGITIHGALVIPTRPFWVALAEIGAVANAGFGNEYETYKKCLRAIGDDELYFSISVDEDGTALLDGVDQAAAPLANDTARFALIRSMFAARRGSFYAQLGELAFEPSDDDDQSTGYRRTGWHVGARDGGENDPPQHDWPLLCTPLESSRDLWGFENFCRVSATAVTLLDGPEGTVKPSIN